MASPTVTWKKHTGTTDISGTTITEITLGTVTAAQWSNNAAVSIEVATNDLYNLRFWLNDSIAVVGGSAVSLGATGDEWDWRVTAVATVGSNSALFGGTGSMMTASGTTLATDYKGGANNSLGAGKSMGTHTSTASYVTAGTRSRVLFLSAQPDTTAFDGEFSEFTFQIGYDFS